MSQAVALADKLDLLVGFWLIDEKPTGSKDPYALRRAALGIIRIVLERGLKLNLFPLIDESLATPAGPTVAERAVDGEAADGRRVVGAARETMLVVFNGRVLDRRRQEAVAVRAGPRDTRLVFPPRLVGRDFLRLRGALLTAQ